MAAALRGENFRAPRLGYKAPEKLGKKPRPRLKARQAFAAGRPPRLVHVSSTSAADDLECGRNATNGVVEKMVPLIAAAPVPRRVREKWLERLLDAIQEDDPPYIESLGEHWGALCADPGLASQWADQLLPLVRHVMADRRSGTYAYSKSGTLCYSALFHAGRYDDLLAVP